MHLRVREIAAAVSSAALILCCSCEKHHLGEDPEAQTERVGQPQAGEENAAAPTKAEKSEQATQKPTPAQFFPENSPSP